MLGTEIGAKSPWELSVDEVQSLLAEWGSACHAFKRRCLWLLPAVLTHGLHFRRGYASAAEYLGRTAGLSPGLVADASSLHARISEFPELWSLLLDNKVGWSKLRILASSGLVTRENSAWWAEQVQRLSRRELEDLVNRLRMQAMSSSLRKAPGSEAQQTTHLSVMEGDTLVDQFNPPGPDFNEETQKAIGTGSPVPQQMPADGNVAAEGLGPPATEDQSPPPTIETQSAGMLPEAQHNTIDVSPSHVNDGERPHQLVLGSGGDDPTPELPVIQADESRRRLSSDRKTDPLYVTKIDPLLSVN